MSKKNNHSSHAPAAPTPAQQIAAIRQKFSRLSQIRQQLAAVKALYVEQEALVKELLPLFITKEEGRFIVNERVAIGNETHTLTPSFWEPSEASYKVKRFKATAVDSIIIQ